MEDGGDNWNVKLQSNRYRQQTVIQLFTGRMPFLLPNQQCQALRGLAVKLDGHNRDVLSVAANGAVYPATSAERQYCLLVRTRLKET